MIEKVLIITAGGITGLFGIHYLGRIWTRWEMNKIINNPAIPEDLKQQARNLKELYNLDKIKTSEGINAPILLDESKMN